MSLCSPVSHLCCPERADPWVKQERKGFVAALQALLTAVFQGQNLHPPRPARPGTAGLPVDTNLVENSSILALDGEMPPKSLG